MPSSTHCGTVVALLGNFTIYSWIIFSFEQMEELYQVKILMSKATLTIGHGTNTNQSEDKTQWVLNYWVIETTILSSKICWNWGKMCCCRYRWEKNGKPFNWQVYDNRMSKQRGRGTLVIVSPRTEDIGKCFS